MTCGFKAQLFGTTSVLIFSLVTNSKHPLILVSFGLLVQKYRQYQRVSWACDGLSLGFRTDPWPNPKLPQTRKHDLYPLLWPKVHTFIFHTKVLQRLANCISYHFLSFPLTCLAFHFISFTPPLFPLPLCCPQVTVRPWLYILVVVQSCGFSDSCFLEESRDYIWVTM